MHIPSIILQLNTYFYVFCILHLFFFKKKPILLWKLEGPPFVDMSAYNKFFYAFPKGIKQSLFIFYNLHISMFQNILLLFLFCRRNPTFPMCGHVRKLLSYRVIPERVREMSSQLFVTIYILSRTLFVNSLVRKCISSVVWHKKTFQNDR